MAAHFPEVPVRRFETNRVLSGICLTLAILLPVLVVYYLATVSASALAGSIGLPGSSPLNVPGFQLSVSQRFVVVVIGVAPVGCMAAALMYVRRCFRRFAQREYFTLEVVRSLRGFAGAIFLSGVTGLLVSPLASVLLSALGGGRVSLTVNVGSSQVLLLLFAGIVWQIATVIAKAVALAEENSQFV